MNTFSTRSAVLLRNKSFGETSTDTGQTKAEGVAANNNNNNNNNNNKLVLYAQSTGPVISGRGWKQKVAVTDRTE